MGKMNNFGVSAMLMRISRTYGWLIAVVVFWLCALRNIELPGLYMDAINPDYLAARWLHPTLKNPAWVLPGPDLPILGNLYHGTQTLYIGLLSYSVLGTSVVSARLTHAFFGAIIVLFAWLIVKRVTGRSLLALGIGLALATDMAFLGCFRTQAYIILAGQAWMMVGCYFAIRATDTGTRQWLPAISGMAMGLAVYGYFVFLFFVPPVALLGIYGKGREGAVRRAYAWGGGFLIGMLPYVIGYIWLATSVGGVKPFIEWMHGALVGLHPTEGSQQGYIAGLYSAYQNAKLGVSGVGNEMMMLGQKTSPGPIMFRPTLLAVAIALLLAGAWRLRKANPKLARIAVACSALPLVYILCAGGFGARMWSHHFTVLVAVGYVSIGLAIHVILEKSPLRFSESVKARMIWSVLGTIFFAMLFAFNLFQQQRVQDRLVETGGVGMSTDALPALARAALADRGDVVWYFPEWGFFMPFVFLTGNQVPYQLELSHNTLTSQYGKYGQVRVVFWKAAEQAGYAHILKENGVEEIRLYTMARRDGQPALYVLSGRLEAEAN